MAPKHLLPSFSIIALSATGHSRGAFAVEKKGRSVWLHSENRLIESCSWSPLVPGSSTERPTASTRASACANLQRSHLAEVVDPFFVALVLACASAVADLAGLAGAHERHASAQSWQSKKRERQSSPSQEHPLIGVCCSLVHLHLRSTPHDPSPLASCT